MQSCGSYEGIHLEVMSEAMRRKRKSWGEGGKQGVRTESRANWEWVEVGWRREDFQGEHGQETGQFQVRDTCRLWQLPGGLENQTNMLRFMPTGFTLLSIRNQQGGVWQMRGHCPLEDTRVEWRMVPPELGLEDCVILVMSFHRGRRDTKCRVPSQVSSILGSNKKKKTKNDWFRKSRQ